MGDAVRGQNEPRNGDTAVISYADSSTLSSSVYDEGMENDYNRVIASAASMPDSADISAVIGHRAAGSDSMRSAHAGGRRPFFTDPSMPTCPSEGVDSFNEFGDADPTMSTLQSLPGETEVCGRNRCSIPRH